MHSCITFPSSPKIFWGCLMDKSKTLQNTSQEFCNMIASTMGRRNVRKNLWRLTKKENICSFPSWCSPITEKNMISVERSEDFPVVLFWKKLWRWIRAWGIVGLVVTGENRSIWKKNPAPVTLKPPPVPDGLANVVSLASELSRQRFEDWNSSKLSTYKHSVPTSQKNSSSPFE
jgi:hypothetical protein